MSFGPNRQNHTDNLIRSIRRFFPGSPIIFATWNSPDITRLSTIKDVNLVLLEDPGSGFRYDGLSHPNNINRQIISSKAAVANAKTEYVVKMRSDMLLTSNRIKRILSNLPSTPDSPVSIFSKYVAVLDRLTLDPSGPLGFPMHPCDHLQAGLLDDVRKYWNVPEMKAVDERYFSLQGNGGISQSDGHIPKHRAESYFWKEIVLAHTGQDLESMLTKESELKISTIDTFIHNIIPLNKKSLGVQSQKYNWGFELSTYTYTFNFLDWYFGAKVYKTKSRLFPVSYVETLGIIYRSLSRTKNYLLGIRF